MSLLFLLILFFICTFQVLIFFPDSCCSMFLFVLWFVLDLENIYVFDVVFGLWCFVSLSCCFWSRLFHLFNLFFVVVFCFMVDLVVFCLLLHVKHFCSFCVWCGIWYGDVEVWYDVAVVGDFASVTYVYYFIFFTSSIIG